MKQVYTIAAFLILTFFCVAPAQATYQAIISGRVVDSTTNLGVPNIWIEMRSDNIDGTGAKGGRYEKTDANGNFMFYGISTGFGCDESAGGWTDMGSPCQQQRVQEFASRRTPLDLDSDGKIDVFGQGVLAGDWGKMQGKQVTSLPQKLESNSPHSGGYQSEFYYGCNSNPFKFRAIKPANFNGTFQDEQSFEFSNSRLNFDITITSNAAEAATPTKVLTSENVSIDEDEWSNFSCISYTPCQELGQCKTIPAAGSNTRRVSITGLSRTIEIITKGTEAPVYLVECMVANDATSKTSRGSYSCTTGSAAGDSYLGLTGGASGYASKLFDEKGVEISDRAITNTTKLPIYEWESTVPANTSSMFMLGYKMEAASEETTSASNLASQQMASLSFGGACTLMKDPYGFIFDGKTLEPLANTSVTLLTNKNGQFSPVEQSDISASPDIGRIENPQQTKSNGTFSFFVPDGVYKLQPQRNGYLFPAVQDNLHAAAKSIYKNLYFGSELVQQGKMIRADIPLMPVDEKTALAYAKNNKVKVMSNVQSIDPQTDEYVIEGIVSHPGANIVLESTTTNANSRILAKTSATSEGVYTIRFARSMLQQGETPSKLTISKKQFVDDAYMSDKTVVTLEPVLSQVEGYAKDADGSILANTPVQVMVPFSANPVYKTTTDEFGAFSVPQNFVPKTEYDLVFETTVGRETQSTSTFMARNYASNQNLAQANGNSAVLGESDTNLEAQLRQVITRIFPFLQGILQP